MPDTPVRLDILNVTVGSKPRYGVMAIHRHKTGLGYVVHYGNLSQAGNQSDWGESEEESRNMKRMAEALLIQLCASAD